MIIFPKSGSVEFATIEGLRVRFARSGQNDGIPVLLTSPWPESLYAFRDLLWRSALVHPIIALDLPGFGHSESRGDVLSPEAMADFVIDVAAHFGITRMHAVGSGCRDVNAALRRRKAARPVRKPCRRRRGAKVDLAAGQLKEIIASPVGTLAEHRWRRDRYGLCKAICIALEIPVSVLEDYRLRHPRDDVSRTPRISSAPIGGICRGSSK